MVTVSELIEAHHNFNQAQGLCSLSFDDCFQSVYNYAVPILQKHNIKSTFYATIDYIGNSLWGDIEKNKWNTERTEEYCIEFPMMTWDDLKSLKGLGHEIGGHSFSHINLDTLSSNAMRLEFYESKMILENKLDCKITSFSYPRGLKPNNYASILSNSDYSNAVTTVNDYVDKSIDIFSVCRYAGPNNVAHVKDNYESSFKLPFKYVSRYLRNKYH